MHGLPVNPQSGATATDRGDLMTRTFGTARKTSATARTAGACERPLSHAVEKPGPHRCSPDSRDPCACDVPLFERACGLAA